LDPEDVEPAQLAPALAYLDSHVNFEKTPSRRRDAPTLDRMLSLCAHLGDPQSAYPVVHVTGTNGKGSTVRMVSSLLAAHGLSVGSYTSPHLEALNERMVFAGRPISDAELASALLGISQLEDHLDLSLTHFEVLTAAALRWFADVAVDVAVVEVGLGGRWDSTNVVTGSVAVVTNVGLDHAEVIGPTRREIAIEKAGIIKPSSTAIIGETDPSLVPLFDAQPAAAAWHRGSEFDCLRNVAAYGGRVIDVLTPVDLATTDILLPLFGPHQGDNAACALAATQAFFDRPIDPSVALSAFASVEVPGRFEIMKRHPLVVLDGAHNPDGARALAATLADDMAGRYPDVLVVGYTAGRDPAEMLSLVGASHARVIIACAPPHPRALPTSSVVDAVASLGLTAEVAQTSSVPAAVARAMESVSDEEFVLVTGSLYVVGDARKVLR
jgi:dihydrofolate synthase/folylpolyglutamate synthase